MRTPLRLGALVLTLLVTLFVALPAPAYVICPNATADPHYIYRDVGTSGLTTGEYTVTWQQWIIADRAAQFQTYYAIGPNPFSGASYDVTFDGNGGVSDNMAVAVEGGGDVYASALPVVGSWKNMAMRHISNGGGSYTNTFYYDLAAGTSNQVSSGPAVVVRWDATTRLHFSNNQWAANDEGCNCRYRCAKLFERLLSEADTQSESASCSIVVSATNLWGQWPLNTDLLDISGNARHLSNSGTVSFVAEGGAPLRMLMGVGQ